MPATASRIGLITQEWRRATVSDDAVQARYGHLARESDDPAETFFDDVDDAAVIATERQALLSRERRRFTLAVSGVDEALGIALGTAPVTALYIDRERDARAPMLVAEVAIDLDRERADMTVWG